MSIWYHCEVTAIAANKTAVAKFFNLDDDYKDVRTDTFQFSFGGKNAPSLTLKKIVQQNPDLIFLCKQDIEGSTIEWFLTRFDVKSNEQQFFWIQDFGDVVNRVSKKSLEDYVKSMPGHTLKILNGEKGHDFRWSYVYGDFDKAAEALNHAEEYKEMVNPWKHHNIKTYIVEYECNYGCEGEESWHKEWHGPVPIAQADAFQTKLTNLPNAKDIKNVSVREVEPK